MDSLLYPWFRTFDTLDEAVAYALEVEGYRELWEAIIVADWRGAIGAN